MEKCKRCGKILKNPMNISMGYGIECWKKVKKELKEQNVSTDENNLS